MTIFARTLMIQGTGSDVGKSVIAAALCRIFVQDGFRVAPFKAQNMALNSFVTDDGGEIGRAQAVQAFAARIAPTVDMNPVLIKPTADTRAQIIVRGKPIGNRSALAYSGFKSTLFPIIRESLRKLRKEYDIVVIEGAGSPAEVNLKNDIVNMRVAAASRSPVLLIGDIDRGGVLASLVGTLSLLSGAERSLIKGFIINKFRGDMALFKSGVRFLERRTGRKVFGVIPYLDDVKIAEEDSLPARLKLSSAGTMHADITIAVARLPHLSNFTDFDPFEHEPDVCLRYVERPDQLRAFDIVMLPGSKNTIGDLAWLKRTGMAREILRLSRRPDKVIVGICGGYQMLGKTISDHGRVESDAGEIRGVGLLPVRTVFGRRKHLSRVTARERATGIPVQGYEIHHGTTSFTGRCSPVFDLLPGGARTTDGASRAGGRVWGTYLHGVFDSDAFRRAFLNRVRSSRGLAPLTARSFAPDRELDSLAAAVRKHLDMHRVYATLGIFRRNHC